MGWNTVVVVMNDAIHDIENDPAFGRRLAQAIREQMGRRHTPIDVPAGGHCNAATVICQDHADAVQLVEVHRNYGRRVSDAG